MSLINSPSIPDSTQIRIDPGEALIQASMTADDILSNALSSVEKHMGEGYAEEHPELVAAVMNVAILDFNNSITNQQNGYMADSVKRLAEALVDLATTIEEK